MEGLYKKLLLIQNSVENLVKNKKSFNFSYVDGNSVLSHIRPIMNDVGLLLKQEILSIENERYDYKTSKGAEKTEVLSKLQMRFTWIDTETGEKDENLFGANGMNDFDKGVGSAMTYGERYFLLKYFHIPTDADDVDAVNRDVATVKTSTYTKPATNGDDKPWLNKGTPEYAGAISKLQKGTTTIEKIQQFYKLNKDVRANLEACTKDLIPEKQLE
jgi:hypothetical protein